MRPLRIRIRNGVLIMAAALGLYTLLWWAVKLAVPDPATRLVMNFIGGFLIGLPTGRATYYLCGKRY